MQTDINDKHLLASIVEQFSDPEKMTDYIINNSEIWTQVGRTLILEACRELISTFRRRQREVAYFGNTPFEKRHEFHRPPVDNNGPAAVQALARSNLNSLMNFPLEDGTLLGDSTHDKLTKMIGYYQSTARSSAVKAKWLLLVQQSLPDGKRVRDVMTNERLNELREEARRDTR